MGRGEEQGSRWMWISFTRGGIVLNSNRSGPDPAALSAAIIVTD